MINNKLSTVTVVKLFSRLPVYSIKRDGLKSTHYLFGFIPVLKFVTNDKIGDGYNNIYSKYANKVCASVGKSICCGGEVFFNNNTYIGDFCCFNGCQIQGPGKVTIGNYFHSGSELLIITHNHNYDNSSHIPYSPDADISKDIEIGDFVWIGSRVTILPGTKIGKGAIIQAGAVVHGNIPPYSIGGGNPIKIFKYRNKEHFDKLEKEKMFY